jgi:hypothetical protein
MDKPEVDKEVKRLFRYLVWFSEINQSLFRDDLSATRTWYEIVTVDDGAVNQKEVMDYENVL